MNNQSFEYFYNIWAHNKVKEAKKYPEFFEWTDAVVTYKDRYDDLRLRNQYDTVFDYMAEMVRRRRVNSLNDLLEAP